MMNRRSNTLYTTGSALIILLQAAFAACSDNDNPPVVVPPPVVASEIRLKSSLGGAAEQSRSLVGGDRFLGGEPIGIYACKVVSERPWDAPAYISNDLAVAADEGAISLSRTSYYPENGDSLAFYAYHPHVEAGKDEVPGKAPEIAYRTDGSTDILYATPVSGNQIDPANILVFRHLLTQLRFRVANDGSYPAGHKVTSLVVEGGNRAVRLHLATGTLGSGEGASTDLVVMPPGSNPVAIKDTAAVVGTAIALSADSSSLRVRLSTDSVAYSGIVIRPTKGEIAFRAGYAYEITLTFRGEKPATGMPIGINTRITDWIRVKGPDIDLGTGRPDNE